MRARGAAMLVGATLLRPGGAVAVAAYVSGRLAPIFRRRLTSGLPASHRMLVQVHNTNSPVHCAAPRRWRATRTARRRVVFLASASSSRQSVADHDEAPAAAADTIFALSSGRGVSGVAVIRLSGPRAAEGLRRLLSADGGDLSKPLPEPRRASVRTLRDPATREVLDEALVLYFRAPKSFTGEDVVELHCHGSSAVVDGVLETLAAFPGFRPAERGEFSRRAFAAGRLGLTQVEGLADLLAATTSRQRRQALSVLSGALERRYARWRDELASVRAAVEACVDFGDDVEGDVPHVRSVLSDARDRVGALGAELRRQLKKSGATAGETVREGVRVVLAGPPNAGKSSLLNALAQRPAAIVSATPGTTRDVLHVDLALDGLAVRLYDTAGLRNEPGDAIEREGMERASAAIADAHLVCYVVDAATTLSSSTSRPRDDDESPFASLFGGGDDIDDDPRGGLTLEADHSLTSSSAEQRLVFVANKRDLLDDDDDVLDRCRDRLGEAIDVSRSGDPLRARLAAAPWVATAAVDHETGGVDALIEHLREAVARVVDDDAAAGGTTTSEGADEAPAIVRARHRRHVSASLDHLDRALEDLADDDRPELGAEDLRLASAELGRVVGAIDVEDVLDHLFADFCIGK